MGIFSDNVVRLYEQGIYTLPCGGPSGKAPIVDGGKNWQKYCEVLPTEEQVSDWEDKYKNEDRLGLILGEASGIVAFDFDYNYDAFKMADISEKDFLKEMQLIEKQILALLPHSPCKKVGRKGWTAFYKWSPGLSNSSSCNRRQVRVFDFLAWHKQTIIPPSLHSVGPDGKDILYKWKGLPLDQCIEDLPHIEMGVINDIEAMFGESETLSAPSRHKRLLDFVLAISSVETDESVIVKKMIERDKIVNKPTYLDDKKHNPTSDPVKNASNWVKRILKWRSATSAKDGKEVTKRMTSDSWDHFFENSFHKVCKDIVTENIFVKKEPTSKWVQVDGLAGVLRTYAADKKLPYMRVADQLERWIFEKEDKGLLCSIPTWDGNDRIADICSRIQSPYFSPEEIVLIFKEWGARLFSRLDDSRNQNRCIILKGEQNLGKDTFVKSLLNGLDDYYRQTTLAGTDKDVLEIVSPLIAVHIEEFDQTARLAVPFIKSLITQDSSSFRASYARSPSKKTMRCSFISTSNADDVLRDPTGNRRFIVIPVESINWGYPKDQSPQCLAQWRHYWSARQFIELPSELQDKIAALIAEYTPEDMTIAVIERYKHLLNENHEFAFGPSRSSFTLGEILPTLHIISKETGLSVRRVQHVIKMAKLSRRTKSGMKYYKMHHDISPINAEGNLLNS